MITEGTFIKLLKDYDIPPEDVVRFLKDALQVSRELHEVRANVTPRLEWLKNEITLVKIERLLFLIEREIWINEAD